MNDFVMSVVDEVLKQNGSGNTVKSYPENEIKALERPNYQRQNQKKRLIAYDIPKTPEQKQEYRSGQEYRANQKDKVNQKVRLSQEISASQESRLSQESGISQNSRISQENRFIQVTSSSRLAGFCKKTMEAHMDEKPYQMTSKKTSEMTPAVSTDARTGSDFIQFPLGDNSSLRRLVGFPYSNKEAACMGMQENCYIRQLFAVDGILRKFPALDFTVKWSVEQKEPFVFQAIGTMNMMQNAVEILNQNCIRQREIQIVDQPSPFLRKMLNISADAIGTIEGVHYAKLIPQAVSYFNKHAESMVECQVFGSYLIFYGQREEVQQVIETIQ